MENDLFESAYQLLDSLRNDEGRMVKTNCKHNQLDRIEAEIRAFESGNFVKHTMYYADIFMIDAFMPCDSRDFEFMSVIGTVYKKFTAKKTFVNQVIDGCYNALVEMELDSQRLQNSGLLPEDIECIKSELQIFISNSKKKYDSLQGEDILLNKFKVSTELDKAMNDRLLMLYERFKKKAAKS